MKNPTNSYRHGEETSITLFTETANPLKWQYPAREFIEYHKDFFDEIVVCDAGSTDGWREWLSQQTLRNGSRIRIVDFKTNSELFTTFGQAGKQKAVAKANCDGEYIVHMDIDTFLVGADKIRWLIEKYPEVDDFAVRVFHFYGNFYTINPGMEGTDCFQHTIMRNIPNIGVGRSWWKSDGAEFMFIPEDARDNYNANLGTGVGEGTGIRFSPLLVKNIFWPIMDLRHYGWCCRSKEIIREKMNRQHTTQEKEWTERPKCPTINEGDPSLVKITPESWLYHHPWAIERTYMYNGRTGYEWNIPEGEL